MNEQKISEEIDLLTKERFEKVEKRARSLLNEAIKNKYNELAKLIVNKIPELIKQGINKYESPLHVAAREDNEEILNFFINSGLDTNKRNERGNTALHEAVLNNNAKATEILLNNDPNLELKNNLGDTAFSIAVRRYEASEMNDKSVKGDKQAIRAIYELVKSHGISKNSISEEIILPEVDLSANNEPKEENYSQKASVGSIQSSGASNGETHLDSLNSSRTTETDAPERPPRIKKAALEKLSEAAVAPERPPRTKKASPETSSEAAVSEIPSRAEAKNEASSMGCKESFSAMARSLRKSFRKKKDSLVKKIGKK